MPAPILIVGQGLAGSLLAWEFERAGIDFEIVDRGHAEASSRIGAGIINPITGQRLVKSWRIDELLPQATKAYREMEGALGIALLRPMRVRRFFSDDRERRIFAEKQLRGELAPYVSAGTANTDGFWIEGGAQLDSAALIAAMRARLQGAGRLREATAMLGEVCERHDLVILCTGIFLQQTRVFDFAGLQAAKGETLTVATESDLREDVILNDGHWVLPLGPRVARVGATFQPGVNDREPTTEGRAELEESARRLLRGGFTVTAHEVGLRMTSPDKHPIVGRSPSDSRLGIFNGLGSKGALLAPGLARQWVNHLTEAVPFEPAVDVKRFANRTGRNSPAKA